MIAEVGDVTTADDLLLLAIDPKTGRLMARPPHTLPMALAGAMLMDLIHDHKATLVDGKVVAGSDTGHDLCDAILARIRRMPIPQGVGYWVTALGSPQFRAQDRVTWRLIERGVVTIDVRTVLVMFASMTYVVAEPHVRDQIAVRVASALTTDEPADPRTLSLIAMAAACGIVDRLIDRQHRRTARRRAQSILQADASSSDAAIAAAQISYAATVEVYSAVCASGHGGGGGGHGGGGHGGH